MIIQEKKTIILSLIAAFFLLFFSIALWFYRDVFDKDKFAEHTSQAILTEDSRNAISSLLIEQTFQNRPLLRNLFLEQAQPGIAGALEGPRVQTVLNLFINQIHDAMFSPQPKAIVLELGNIKTFVESIISVVQSIAGGERQQVTIPDRIVLVKAGDIPSIASIGMVFLWFGPFALMIALGTYLWLMIKSDRKIVTLQIIGASLAGVVLLAVLLQKWYQPIFLSRFQNAHTLTIAQEIVNEFSQSLARQNYLLIGIGAVLLLGGLVFQRMALRRKSGGEKK